MKKLTKTGQFRKVTLIFFLTLSVLGCEPQQPSVENIIDHSELVERDGLIFAQFSNDPINGIVRGEIQGRLVDGKWEGSVERYFDNGELFTETQYKGGVKNGLEIVRYKGGTLWQSTRFVDGSIRYDDDFYRDGRMKLRYTKTNDQSQGFVTRFLVSGEPIAVWTIKDGVLNGKATRNIFDGDGYGYEYSEKLYLKATWSNGYLEGECLVFDRDGELRVTLTFSKNELVDYKTTKKETFDVLTQAVTTKDCRDRPTNYLDPTNYL